MSKKTKGLKEENLKLKIYIKELEGKVSQLNNLDENTKILLESTERELRRSNDSSQSFFQHRANHFVRYIKVLKAEGTEMQKYMINTIREQQEQAAKHLKANALLQHKLDSIVK
jgi:hypothetical protein